MERQPLKKVEPDENDLLKLLHRWRRKLKRRAIRSSASPSPLRSAGTVSGWLGGSGLAGIEAHVIHAASVAVWQPNPILPNDPEPWIARYLGGSG